MEKYKIKRYDEKNTRNVRKDIARRGNSLYKANRMDTSAVAVCKI